MPPGITSFATAFLSAARSGESVSPGWSISSPAIPEARRSRDWETRPWTVSPSARSASSISVKSTQDGDVAAPGVGEDVARHPVPHERLESPVRAGRTVEGAGRRAVVEDEEDSPGEPGADRPREGCRAGPDLEKLPRLQEDAAAGEPREKLRAVGAGGIDPFEPPGGVGSDPSLAEGCVLPDAKRADRESVEELVGDDETGEAGREVVDGGDETGPGDAGSRGRPAYRRGLHPGETDVELLRPGAGEETEELPLARPDVDDVDRRRDLGREARGDPDEAAGERRVPGSPGHEVSRSTHPSRLLVVAPFRVVERGLLEGVETERALALDPVAKAFGEGVPAHGRILSASGPLRQG